MPGFMPDALEMLWNFIQPSAEAAPPKAGTKAYRDALYAKPKPDESQRALLEAILPQMNVAIKKAENNPKNFGVLSQEVKSPKQANKVLNQSIANNFWRWLQADKPGKYVDFMRDRWAPIGAENDPDNLNQNWAPNVRYFLEKLLGPEEYKKWQELNLVLLNGGGTYDV